MAEENRFGGEKLSIGFNMIDVHREGIDKNRRTRGHFQHKTQNFY